MRLITDTFEYCSKNIPKWNTISVGAYHIREAGASEVQEIAFAFANAMAYIDAAIKAGQKVDDFAPGISWILQQGLISSAKLPNSVRRAVCGHAL